MLFLSLYLVTVLSVAYAATPAQWRSRSIYQVMTDRFARTDQSTTASCPPGYGGYCGGSWAGLTKKLDYIQGMGFDAVWISPIVKQIDDPARAYHGYSAQDIYSLNSNFGTATDLQNLMKALHSRGMYLMVDVVANHFGANGPCSSIDYAQMNPFNDESFYHPICWITDYNNQTNAEDCWIGNDNDPLPDLDTSNSNVRTMFHSWIEWLVSTYSIDGLRIDSVRNVEMDFWSSFNSAAGVYAVGEVADGRDDYVCPYQDQVDGILQYPTYYQATTFFSDPTVTTYNLVNEFNYRNVLCKDPTLMGSFSENHDQARFASHTSDMVLAKNIITFTMLSDGIPIIYSGQEAHLSGAADPYDREAIWLTSYPTTAPLYQHIKSLNAIRQLAIAKSSAHTTSLAKIVYSDYHNIAISKGNDGSYMTLTVVNNLGSAAQDYNVTMANVGFSPGLNVVDVLSCREVVVGGNGTLVAQFEGGLPMVYYPFSLLAGTGWCGQ